ncbi:citramalyl-CoA lyase, mitochondrial-like isoform X1 [Haliotis rubra]|uniref:citramalyl-CoA lyase, mitochondrial-like isoform X1 n=1 Tax=Haliotis rubra TaxID=36100 RepID=UPI001EE57716|nr:citramalyl-CoA lyase, mitochondrial-like isoform X1 [Haliotis rubra]XP_046556215.1 citramalyl-CoA lyase, mitochondrial-like isoform X1 [Haliotis rubra]XP_046556216.1 citramalyl-CoA lyase, mitochondrial-like isoform X1 [Haliotis rubra]XP_046556218.1 citramalyl-CoA lyase, mitochondrial-like isoform X1 [Haliotis rubra]XP_046556219.1 citramalyl-CoA lyase, mitochondrial-like isoform X1 [Haliotis rubra]
MYVPGHDVKKLRKVPKLGVDCAVLECEDGVALSQKADARENIRQMLDEVDFSGVDCAVRVNSVSSGLVEEDLRVIFKADRLPQTILLPKVDTVEDLTQFTDLLQSVTADRKDYCPYLLTYVESAQGVLNMQDVLQRARQYSTQGVFYMDGVVFGSDDFCADIGAVRTTDARELTYARQKVVMVAKAFRLQAIDLVFINIKDTESLRHQSLEGARMGYTGKQVIHPGQVSTVRDAFTPSEERVQWATELVAAFQQHQESGKGAFTFHGNMIDMPLLLQAKNILKIVTNIESSGS